jgi:ribosome maturation factor RimP
MVDAALRELIHRCVENHSAHLIDVTVRGRRRRPVVEVFVDTESGVTTGLCSEISREVSHELQHHRLLPEVYSLIVSSPGIERPLTFPWQYTKHVGRTLRLMVRSWQGIETMTGVLRAVDDTGLTLQTGTQAGETEASGGTHVQFDAIDEAVVQAPW